MVLEAATSEVKGPAPGEDLLLYSMEAGEGERQRQRQTETKRQRKTE
jgi:hypothetical protein